MIQARTIVGSAALLAVALLTSGCGIFVGADTRRADLIPEAVAWRSIEKYLGSEWVANPHLENACDAAKKIPIKVSTIRAVRFYAVTGDTVVANTTVVPTEMSCDDGRVSIEGLTRAQADELATAFASLGAPLYAK